MTTTTEKTDIEQCEEWNIRQMCARLNGNKIYKVIVQQQFDYKIYQASFIEDGFRNKTQVKDFYMGDGCGGNRHFGNEELFKQISCFASPLVEMNDSRRFHYQLVSPARRVETTVYPTKSSKEYGSPDFIPHHQRTWDHKVHPDWTYVRKTFQNPKNNYIKLISITEMK